MLIGVIAKIWVLKSERVLVSEGIEATPIRAHAAHGPYALARSEVL